MKKQRTATAFSIYETSAGFGVLAANDDGLVDHLLPYGARSWNEAADSTASLHPLATEESSLTAQGAALLKRYFAGEKEVLFDLPLDLDGFTPFQKCVYQVVANIPYGTAMSYAEVAAACGSPNGARAVGGAMSKNPLPIIIPCHRVMGASGVLTGFTAPGGVVSKRELLVMEGTVFSVGGRVLEANSFRL
jgi:methylated-DNA-[protein]-cysteine S-methyltransferase